MKCDDFRQLADSFLSDELTVETNHKMLKHLEDCPACRAELEARRELRRKLRQAMWHTSHGEQTEPRAEFAARLRTQLQTENAARSGFAMWRETRARQIAFATLVAGALLIGVITYALLRTRQDETRSAREIVGISSEGENRDSANTNELNFDEMVAEVSRIAVEDHLLCGLNNNTPEPPISLEEAGRRYDRAYFDLAQAVMRSQVDVTHGVEFVKAHSCVIGGRRFGHVILKRNDVTVSVVVTPLDRSRQPRARGANGLETSTPPVGQATLCPPVAGYQVSCFETARYAVFVVSSLSDEENLALARLFAPSVSEHLIRAESNT